MVSKMLSFRKKEKVNVRFFSRVMYFVCKKSNKNPIIWFILAMIISLPFYFQAKKIRLDVDPIRLLPKNSRAAINAVKMKPLLGSMSFFTLLIQGAEKEKLQEVVTVASAKIKKIINVESVEFKYPISFIRKYNHLLIPLNYLEDISDLIVRTKSRINPLTSDMLAEEDLIKSDIGKDKSGDIDKLISKYGNISNFHCSKNGKIFGIIIYPDQDLINLNIVKEIFIQLQKIRVEVSKSFGVKANIGGYLRNWIEGQNVIMGDLKRSGIIMTIGILLVLLISFNSIRIIPLLILPILIGLVWSFGLVRIIIGDINTITAFLLLISFGLGIDFSIHLVKRFSKELIKRTPYHALVRTFSSTGKSVFLSGLTTSVALFFMGISGFRGVSEFGIVGGLTLSIILIVILTFMPSMMILGYKIGIIKKSCIKKSRTLFPTPIISSSILLLTVIFLFFGVVKLEFDYDFDHMEPKTSGLKEIKRYQEQVYPTTLVPQAIYIAENLSALDKMSRILRLSKKNNPDTKIGWIRSIRDFCPDDSETGKRLMKLKEIKEQLKGRWVSRIKDPEIMKWINSLIKSIPPERQPDIKELPVSLKRNLICKGDVSKYILAVYPNTSINNGKDAMNFTKEIYNLKNSHNIIGPSGGGPVISEILWLVESEALWLIMIPFTGITLLILLYQRSVKQTIFILFPLLSGIFLTIGIMAIFGLKMNFFNIVVLPSLVGIGIDDGIHYFRRWMENDKNIVLTQEELFGPLTITTLTTILGYSGLIFAHNSGLRSIGMIACIGLLCTWLTSLFLLPGILNFFQKTGRSTDKINST